MKGEITADSVPGNYTTMRITLPAPIKRSENK
jgi:hypothetical protein